MLIPPNFQKLLPHKSGKKEDFDGLVNESLNSKDIIIKNLQVQSYRLRKKVNAHENKILILESGHNSLEQYRCCNNIEITGIPDSIPNQNLEEKVVNILSEISVENLNVVVILIKYIQQTERCIFQVQKYTEEKYHIIYHIKHYHINDLFNLFAYYDFGENYWGNN